LLPFIKAEVEEALAAMGAQPFGQVPAMVEIKLFRQAGQTPLEMRQVDRGQALGIDPRPDNMRMPAAFLLMNDDRTRLAVEAEGLFRPIRCPFEILFACHRALRRAQAQRKQILFALCGLGDGFRLPQRTMQVFGNEAFELQHRDMIIVAIIEQVGGQLLCACALRTLQDHGANLFGCAAARAKLWDVDSGVRWWSSTFRPSARISSRRIARTSSQARVSSAVVAASQ